MNINTVTVACICGTPHTLTAETSGERCQCGRWVSLLKSRDGKELRVWVSSDNNENTDYNWAAPEVIDASWWKK